MRTIAAFAVLLIVAACQAPPPAEMTEAEIAQYEAEVKEQLTNRLNEYGEALGAGAHPHLSHGRGRLPDGGVLWRQVDDLHQGRGRPVHRRPEERSQSGIH